jgi:hypothetical protein
LDDVTFTPGGKTTINQMIDAHRIAPTHSILFGGSERPKEQKEQNSRHEYVSLRAYFFGFLLWEEEEFDEDDRLYASSSISAATKLFTPLHIALSTSLALMSAAIATTHPLLARSGPSAAVAAILGNAAGKLGLGCVPDLLGARRTALSFAWANAATFLLWTFWGATSNSPSSFLFLMEFLSSVQWPCTIVLLATHHRGNTTGLYEAGIWVTSLAGRLGSLAGLVIASHLLIPSQQQEYDPVNGTHYQHRWTAAMATWLTAIAASILYLHVQDAPLALHAPQNPEVAVTADHLHIASHSTAAIDRRGKPIRRCLRLFYLNIRPSVRHILLSPTFWILVVGHFGATLVKTSERFISLYLISSTSFNTVNGAIWHSTGMIAGLLLAGKLFASQNERGRQWLAARLYILSIVSCYMLCLTSIPAVRHFVTDDVLVSLLQRTAMFLAAFGIAVQYYHIPPLVGATYGCDKGLFLAYTDGLASALAASIWCYRMPELKDANGAYAWAAVALGLMVSAVVMMEFLHHFFRPRGASYTASSILLA